MNGGEEPWWTWRENAEYCADVRVKVGGFLARLVNKEMSAAWERWQNWAVEQAEARDATERALRWWTNKVRVVQAMLNSSFDPRLERRRPISNR